MPLHKVPTEILAHIAVFLDCHDPFSPPRHLLALQSTSKFYRHSLNHHLNPVVWATAFRFRFDHRPVIRRNFSPTGRDYYDQLRQYTTTLVALNHQDYDSDDDILKTVYVMLLDNDGKNRAQLEHAGIDIYLANYLHTRLWLDTDINDGWPVDRSASVYGLWSLWMVTTPEKLQAESMADREAIVTLILPFVLNPYRYHQAEAHPSHFLLPVPDHISLSSSLPYAHGPYPIYIKHTDNVPYFGSIQTFSQPPIATAAKLLYFARRETIPFNVPHGIPPTRAQAPATVPAPTLEDFLEINSHKGAQPPPAVTWDWDNGCPFVDGIPDGQLGFDYSIQWDPDYWRRRLCLNVSMSDPKWRPGSVYVPGSMDGLWQGRLIFPPENSLRQLLERAQFPDDGSFTETDLHLTHQPIFMRLKEHHAVSTSSAPVHIPFSSHPHHRPHATQTTNDDMSQWTDLSMRNAWFPGVPGTVSFITPQPRRPYPSNTNTEESRVLITLYDQTPSETQPLPPPNQRSVWLYKTYSRQLDAERRKRAKLSQFSETSYIPHSGSEECETCSEREEVIKRANVLDQADLEAIAAAYDKDWEMLDEIENMFSSVGLGRDDTEDLSDEEMDEGEEEEEGEGEEDYSGDEAEEVDGVELEFLPDANAEVSLLDACDTRPVRRGTDRAKIKPCDGIQDIVFSGATDRRHALAWNDFTFYGRVRPWDGLIGVLRRSYWPRQNFIFFYGYLVGGETFVGNWRFAAIDPRTPTWESAFVMSRRKDDDLGRGSTSSGQRSM